MDSLYALAEELEPGHYLAWQAENAKDVERTRPKTVTKVEKTGDVILVEAEGQGDGEYHFEVGPTTTSEAYYHDPSSDDPKPLGRVTFAELTDSRDFVTVKRGWYDSRRETN